MKKLYKINILVIIIYCLIVGCKPQKRIDYVNEYNDFKDKDTLILTINNNYFKDKDTLILSIINNSTKTYALPIEEPLYFSNYLDYRNGREKWNKVNVFSNDSTPLKIMLTVILPNPPSEIVKNYSINHKLIVIQPNQTAKIKIPFKFKIKRFDGIELKSYVFDISKKYFLNFQYMPSYMFYNQKKLDSLKRKGIKIYDKPIVSNKVPIVLE